MSRVGAREYSNSYLFYFGFSLKSHTFSHTTPPPLTTQRARASAILTQISGNGKNVNYSWEVIQFVSCVKKHEYQINGIVGTLKGIA